MPIVEFMTFNFAMQAMDHLINSAAKTNYMSGGQMGCPMVFRGPNGAASRVAAQHSRVLRELVCARTWHLCCFTIFSSGCERTSKISNCDPNPVIFLENEILYGQSFEVPDDPEWTVPIGRAKVVREGSDVTITAFRLW